MFSSNRGNNVAIHPGRRPATDSHGREGFRPVALPALAAAVHVAHAAQAARDKPARRGTRRFVHEDEPAE